MQLGISVWDEYQLNKGFTFIELILVLAILGILAAIAYPGYQNYITRARRSDGQMALLDLANRLERYYAEHHSYKNAADVIRLNTSPEGWYSLSIASATDSDYVLQAKAIGAQANHDSQYQTLSLTSSGKSSW